MSQPNPQAGVGQQVGPTLGGIGGLMVSGRWHHRGHPILYTSSTAALVALEVLVPADPLQVPDDRHLLGLDVPDDLDSEVLNPARLPDDWSPSFARDSHRILCFRRSLSHTRAAPDEPAQRSPSPAFQRRSPA